MAEKIDVAALVARMPELDPAVEEKDKQGKPRKNTTNEFKLTGPKWTDAVKVYDALLAGGRDAILELIGMVSEGNDPKLYRPRYVLHGLALYLCRPEKQQQRTTFVEALLSQLGGDRPKYVQAFIIREIEVVGNESAAPVLGKLLLDEELGDPAAKALLAIRAGAVGQFRAALPNASGRARLTIIQSLGVLGDATSADALKQAAADQDVDLRLAALWALAKVGGPGVVDMLIKASDTEGWERIQATKACLLAAENLVSAGRRDDAANIYRHLRDTRTDPKEQYVREAATKALAAAGER